MKVGAGLPALAALFLALPASASIPGNIQERAREGLQHVCVDTEPDRPLYVECELQEGGFVDAPYTGEECTAEGLPAECVLDFVPRVRVRGTVTIVHDDTARAGNDDDVGDQTALILELGMRGGRVRLYELFVGTKLGNWNSFGVENALLTGNIQIADPAMTVYQFANDNLSDLGDRIVELVDRAFRREDLSLTLPVVTQLERVDRQSRDASADPTATATTWKLTLEFVRIRD